MARELPWFRIGITGFVVAAVVGVILVVRGGHTVPDEVQPIEFGLIGLMLRWRLDPHAVFTLAVLNPVEAARLALLSHLQPELSTFGPVGFYLANRVGGGALFAIGVAWPAVVGLGAYLGFRRSDRI